MREATQVKKMKVPIRISMEMATSYILTPNGIRTIMMIGEVKGIMDIQSANCPSGFSIIVVMATKEVISGSVTGSINCCMSVSASTAEPMAANMELYSK